MSIKERLNGLTASLPESATLVLVSKTHSDEDIMEAYESGHRVFGESRVQELTPKYESLPKDIKWHMIGHMQRNKIKYIAPFVDLIHSVDSLRLLRMVDSEAEKCDRVIDILLQVLVAQEDSKHGWEVDELERFIASDDYKEFKNIRIRGIMGMASFTDDMVQVGGEFDQIRAIFERLKEQYIIDPSFDTLSMGMSSDYETAIKCGSTMVRVGSLVFGER